MTDITDTFIQLTHVENLDDLAGFNGQVLVVNEGNNKFALAGNVQGYENGNLQLSEVTQVGDYENELSTVVNPSEVFGSIKKYEGDMALKGITSTIPRADLDGYEVYKVNHAVSILPVTSVDQLDDYKGNVMFIRDDSSKFVTVGEFDHFQNMPGVFRVKDHVQIPLESLGVDADDIASVIFGAQADYKGPDVFKGGSTGYHVMPSRIGSEFKVYTVKPI